MAAVPQATGERFLVSEVYATIQGESSLVGYPTVFVRLYSCNLRCAWCDSMHAVEGGEYGEEPVEDVVRKIADLARGISHVCWTGGEPLLQWRSMVAAITKLPPHLVHSVETDGEVPLEPIGAALRPRRDDGRLRFVMDVKCPGSGMMAKMAVDNLAHLRAEDDVKFVILDRTDYDFAREFLRTHRIPGTVLFSPVTPAHKVVRGLNPAELASWILADGLNVRLQLQVHKVIWPDRDRGI